MREILRTWYVKYHRKLPWRAEPGQQNDPYSVWLSEIMLQQTTVPAVIPYFLKFKAAWPNVQALANAKDEDVLDAWAGLGYYSRARNLLKCARELVSQHNGIFPDAEATLIKLPGIGPYTAAAIRAIAFQKPAPVLDGNIERVTSRLYAEATPLPEAKPLLRHYAADLVAGDYPGDMAQALMDLGAGVCTSGMPNCSLCPLEPFCEAKAQGQQAQYPVKAPKKERPTRYGYILLLEKDEHILCERRAPKGLLGGMVGLPTSAWQDDMPPLSSDITGVAKIGQARHVFTHFTLILDVYKGAWTGQLLDETPYFWLDTKRDWEKKLPTVFRKAAILLR